MRGLGALLVVVSCGYVGVSQGMVLRQRVELLEALRTAAALMKNEISGNLTPLAQIYYQAAQVMPKPLSELFLNLGQALDRGTDQSLSSLWREALAELGLPLRPRERQTLLDLAGALGRYDVQGQLRALDLAESRLELFAHEASEELRGKGRSWGVLGVCAGLAVVILLL